ncbi:hypothetical protein QBC42DRAFT_283514 [Cladorrhinum samala]|uniref:Copper-fist domain-containing protein n=1 Tax=Cladorrhinum samala TaxID=585594 RepID=A0AAV9HWZ5_9PEZI|nr:hypothetical protein QBC42DRAFT_283514 [Cladorrhinum samala]
MDLQPSDLIKQVRLAVGGCFKCASSDHKTSGCQAADETNLSLEDASGPDFDSSLMDGLSSAACQSEAAMRREQRKATHAAHFAGTSRTARRRARRAAREAEAAAVTNAEAVRTKIPDPAAAAIIRVSTSTPGPLTEITSSDAEAPPVPATPTTTIPRGAVVVDLTVEPPHVSPVRASPPHPFHKDRKFDSNRFYRESDGNIVEEYVRRWSCCNKMVDAYDDRCLHRW